MKALFSFLPEVRPANNFEDLKNNIFGYEHTEQCLIAGIKRFPAGSYAQLDLKNYQLLIHRFWNTKEHLVKVPDSYEEQVEQFRELFIDACKIRMRADVPIGTALSGGLDSSATISTMAYIDKHNKDQRGAKDWQHAFVAAFPGTFLDETYYAQKVVDDIKIPATFINIDPEKDIENLDHYLYLFEELYITSPVPMMKTYKAIRGNGVVVSIDGHGADEMMSGYGHLPLNLIDCGANIFKIKNMLNTLQPLQSFDTVQLKKTTYNRAWYLAYMQQQLKGRKALGKYYVKSLLHRLPQERADQGAYGHLNRALYEMFHETILPTLLRNYDRYSMASGVEIRMPFMDYRLVSFAFSLPWESKVKNGYSKSIIRDAMKGILTDEVRLRKSKIGFNTPIVDWMKGAWKNYLMDMIYSRHFNESVMIDSATVRNQILQVIQNPHALYVQGEQAWTSLMPYLWEKNVIKNFKKYQV
jgi:asparagine synthase (glutamine-hydrolysing)